MMKYCHTCGEEIDIFNSDEFILDDDNDIYCDEFCYCKYLSKIGYLTYGRNLSLDDRKEL